MLRLSFCFGFLFGMCYFFVAEARTPQGKLVVDGKGRQVYNVTCYKLGFTTATKVSDPAKAAGYLAKYITKELAVPRGKKSYWASKGLSRPQEDYIEMSSVQFGHIYNKARYSKVIDGPYGKFILAEVMKGGK